MSDNLALNAWKAEEQSGNRCFLFELCKTLIWKWLLCLWYRLRNQTKMRKLDDEIREIKKEILQLEDYEIKDLDEDELTTYVTTINKEVA